MTSRDWPPSPDYLLDELNTVALEITLSPERSYQITNALGPSERVLDMTHAELLGPLSDVMALMRPGDRPPAETLIPSTTDTNARFAGDLRAPDGGWSRYAFSTRRSDDQRLVMTVTRVANRLSDIEHTEVSQELELVERRYKAVFEASLDPLILIGPEGRLAEVSHGIESLIGWTSSEALGRHVTEYLPEGDLADVTEYWQRLRDGEALRVQLDVLHRDGTTVPSQVSATSVMLDGSTYVVVVMRDLRKTIEMRTALEKIEQRLARAEKLELVGELAGGIAHDIHNMLAVITGTAQMMLRENHSEVIRGDAEAITAAGKTAAGLAKRLLELGKPSPENQRVHFHETLDTLDPLLARLLPDNIDLTTDLAPGLPAVDLNAGALEQLVLNLVINARDAIESDGEISLSVRPTSRPSYGIQLEVEDNGLGMPPDTVERIFEPLYTTKGEHGTGLGLSTVARIVEKAGGTREVQSEEGVGTRFVLRLPATELDSEELLSASTEAVQVERPLDVLVVDDTPNALRYLSRVLASQGWQPRTAASMDEALDEMDSDPSVDVIVTDFHMPGGSGVDLMHKVHNRRPDLPVVFVTADQFFEPPETAAATLHKPFTPSELLEAISRACHA